MRSRQGGKIGFGTAGNLPACGHEVVADNPPRHGIDDEVVGDQEQARSGTPPYEQRADERTSLQIQLRSKTLHLDLQRELGAVEYLQLQSGCRYQRLTPFAIGNREPKPKGVVAADRRRQRPANHRGMDVRRNVEQDPLGELSRRWRTGREEPPLNRRERDHSADVRVRQRARGDRRRRGGGEPGDRLVLKDLRRRQGQAGGTRTRHHLKGDDRVTADLEKIVAHANVLDTQQVGPDAAEHRFVGGERHQRGAWRRRRRFDGRQSAAIDLAVRCQRPGVNTGERLRDHVRRKRRGQLRAQPVRVRLAHVVGHEPRSG